ncbi:phosphoenolpyruvate--protein phosphotransferase [bacterium]|nr:phosphoenolpyruvate--protein phosphotransferase [bacterium]
MVGRRTFFFDGLGVSDGIAIGPAYVVESQGAPSEGYQLSDDEVEQEIERFKKAVQMAKDEIRAIGRQVAEKIDHQQAAIFDAHLMMLDDPVIIEPTIDRIRDEKSNAESIFWAVTKGLGEQLRTLDEYFSERNHDLYDVARRVIKFLTQLTDASTHVMPREGCIIVAHDLGPTETAQLSREHVLGFCTNEGGPTSHTAIMAKALALPAVVGLEYVTHYIRSGDMIIMDGTEGKLILNPSLHQIEFYRRKADDYRSLRLSLVELRDEPAVTTDGTRVNLYANIEFPEELDAVIENGAEGIGLFRTEFLYLSDGGPAGESDHLREYQEVLTRMGDKPVVLRTMDVGGDKIAANDYSVPELNPFMGLRAIRLCLKNQDIFRSQLRAMLLAGAGRDIQIMLPMISSIDEVRASRQILDELMTQLGKNGHDLPTNVRLGAMIEIPSAALQAHVLAKEVDFFSIGTNDLVQYTLAVDRVNKSVAHLYRPAHPAVLGLLKYVTDSARNAGIPVSVCGEMAADPRYAILLAGLGIRSLSMGPSSIGVVKRAIRTIAIAEAKSLAQEVLTLSSTEEVEAHLHRRLEKLFAKPVSPVAAPEVRAPGNSA